MVMVPESGVKSTELSWSFRLKIVRFHDGWFVGNNGNVAANNSRPRENAGYGGSYRAGAAGPVLVCRGGAGLQREDKADCVACVDVM
jgi:hypothetical protein